MPVLIKQVINFYFIFKDHSFDVLDVANQLTKFGELMNIKLATLEQEWCWAGRF